MVVTPSILEKQKLERKKAFDRMMQQYDRQQRSDAYLSSQELQAQQDKEYDDAITTGDSTATGAAAGSAFGMPGMIVGSVLGTIPAKGEEYKAREARYKTGKREAGESGNAVLDTFFNPATTLPSLAKGLFGSAGAVTQTASNLKGIERDKEEKVIRDKQAELLDAYLGRDDAPSGTPESPYSGQTELSLDWNPSGAQLQGPEQLMGGSTPNATQLGPKFKKKSPFGTPPLKLGKF